MYSKLDKDISNIKNQHEQKIEEEEQNNSEKLFMEGFNSQQLPSQKQNTKRQSIAF